MRLLNVGETIEKGDEYLSLATGEWVKLVEGCTLFGQPVPMPRLYRRPEAPKPPADVGEGYRPLHAGEFVSNDHDVYDSCLGRWISAVTASLCVGSRLPPELTGFYRCRQENYYYLPKYSNIAYGDEFFNGAWSKVTPGEANGKPVTKELAYRYRRPKSAAGWRLLEKGECLKAGDFHVDCNTGRWVEADKLYSGMVARTGHVRRPQKLLDACIQEELDGLKKTCKELEKSSYPVAKDHCKAVMDNLRIDSDTSSKSFLIDSIDKLASLVKKYETQLGKMKETPHRMLVKGEVIIAGDECVISGNWHPVDTGAIGQGLWESNVGKFRRPGWDDNYRPLVASDVVREGDERLIDKKWGPAIVSVGTAVSGHQAGLWRRKLEKHDSGTVEKLMKELKEAKEHAYRHLNDGEEIKAGDEFVDHNGTWKKATIIGEFIRPGMGKNFRRRQLAVDAGEVERLRAQVKHADDRYYELRKRVQEAIK